MEKLESLVGKLIVFEGADGTGKTTVMKALWSLLRSNGIRCKRYAFPGGGKRTIGSLVYELHHRPSTFGITNITAASLQTMHVAAHVDSIERYILPALASNACVLLDRFWWSTWVYGVVAGIAPEILNLLISFERAIWGSIHPEVVVRMMRSASGNFEINREYDRLAKHQSRFVRVVQLETRDKVEETLDSTLSAILTRPKPAHRRQRSIGAKSITDEQRHRQKF